jgi:hypothetical protein
MKSLLHDCAFAGAKACLDAVAGCIREDEQRDAAEAFYEVIKAVIEKYELMLERRDRRLYPSRN